VGLEACRGPEQSGILAVGSHKWNLEIVERGRKSALRTGWSRVCVQVCARTFSGLSASEPSVMPPPAPWLSHFAVCLPDLPQIQAPPLFYTRPSSHSMGPSPSPSCLAQTSTIYIYNDNLINDSLRNLTKRTNQRESRIQPSFLTLPFNTI
jgi:hypothetical protein